MRHTTIPRLLLGPLLLCSACGDPIADDRLSVLLRVDALVPGVVPTSAGSELAILGVNFGPDTQVTIGGQAPLAVERISAERLKVIAPRLPVGLTEVVVTSGDQQATSPTPLRVWADQIQLEDRSLALPVIPSSFVPGDVDGDGLDDIIYTRWVGPMEWAKNVGGSAQFVPQGPLTPAAPEAFGARLFGFDLNGDGRTDVVDGRGNLFLSQAGGFEVLRPFDPRDPAELRGVVAVDLDGDGLPSLLAFNSAPTEPPLLVVDLDGTGHPTQRWTPPIQPNRSFWRTPAAADFDLDGFADLIYLGVDQRLHLARGPDLLEGPAFGPAADTFAPDTGLQAGNFSEAAPYEGPDLIAVDENRVFIFKGLGDGTFKAPVEQLLPCEGRSGLSEMMRVPDRLGTTYLTCDGHLYGAAPTLFDGFTWPSAFAREVGSAQAGDFDGDPFPDFLASSALGLVVGHGTLGHGFESGWGLVTATGPDHLDRPTATPYRHGTDRELLVTDGKSLRLLASSGGLPSFGPVLAEAIAVGDIRMIAACDVDGDQQDDAIVLSREWDQTGRLRVFYGDGDRLRPGEVLGDGIEYFDEMQIRIWGDDLDGDGLCDPTLQLDRSDWYGQTPQISASTTVYLRGPSGFDGHSIDLCDLPAKPADLDGDGDIDFYYALPRIEQSQWARHMDLRVFLNDGAGGFTQSPAAGPSSLFDLPLPGHTSPMLVTDLEIAIGPDGQLIFWAVGEPDYGELPSVWAATGDFHLGAAPSNLAFAQGGAFVERPRLRLGDVNGDAVADLLVVGTRGDYPSARDEVGLLFTSRPGGELRSGPSFATAIGNDGVRDAFLIDVNQDGLDDVVYSNYARATTLKILTVKSE